MRIANAKSKHMCVHECLLSCVSLIATLGTVACQAPLSMGFSRQEYWSALPFPHPGDLPDPGIILVSPMSPALAGGYFTTVPHGSPFTMSRIWKIVLQEWRKAYMKT